MISADWIGFPHQCRDNTKHSKVIVDCMRDLDETDLQILRMLRNDGRRPFSDIAATVGLSPPAVSDRIDRLQELGVIKRFTVELDRDLLHHGHHTMLMIHPNPAESASLYEELVARDEVADAFRLADGRILVNAYLPSTDGTAWLRSALDEPIETSLDVNPVVETAESDKLHPSAFELSCVVCGNDVDEDGELERFDGSIKPFCCESCLARYETEFDELRRRAGE